jgi:hypothetical protein
VNWSQISATHVVHSVYFGVPFIKFYTHVIPLSPAYDTARYLPWHSVRIQYIEKEEVSKKEKTLTKIGRVKAPLSLGRLVGESSEFRIAQALFIIYYVVLPCLAHLYA